MWGFKMIVGFGSPGGLLLVLAYFFVFQAILTLFGWALKDQREKILNWNIVIGMLPLAASIKVVFSNYIHDAWSSGTSLFAYIGVCGTISIILWGVNVLSKLDLLKIRWYFFVYINVIGGWIFSILI